MSYSKSYNRVLLAAVLVGLMASLVISWQRHQVEVANSTVELVMDYEDLGALARSEGMETGDVLRQFRQAGLTTLAVYETTLEKLHNSGTVTVLSGAELMHRQRSGSLPDPDWRSRIETGQVAIDKVYITGPVSAAFREMREDLIRRLGPGRVVELAVGPQPVLAVKGDYEHLSKVDLGFSGEELKAVTGAGFLAAPRPTNYQAVQADDVAAVFRRLDQAGQDKLSAMIFSGEEVLGFPEQLEATAEALNQRHMTLGLIEHAVQLQFYPQKGLMDLARQVDYRAARLYSIPKDEQPRMKLEDVTHRWSVSDQERNLRLNLMRPYEKPWPDMTLLETNLEYVRGTKAALEQKGFAVGRAGVFAPYFPEKWLLVLTVIGVVAAGVLYLTQVAPLPARVQYWLLVIGSLILAGPLLLGGGTLARQVAALGSAVLFPALAMVYQMDRWRNTEPLRGPCLKKILTDGLGGLLLTFCLSLVGAFFLAAILADVRFLLEIEIYRGVKLTFIAPLVLVAVAYLTRFNLFGESSRPDLQGVWGQVRKMLDYPISLKLLLLFAMGALAGYIFIGRSGHTAGVTVPAIELKIRAFLERVMYARPREKEFLIGHPAFLLSVFALYHRWPQLLHFCLVIGATIGQASMVQTFAHLRTPVLMSLYRGADGIVLGAALAVAAVVVMQVLAYLSFALERRFAAHD
ncbi:hypothetical protein ALO_19097 [Acetonema longum DSM 6540]|uniref:Uncharacterized protein n=1 Tax=Acetonema longum DSM 6540 TaxID=1009370 RepID=F7NNX8_9FIRM|nr:hypothetical protein ALO_19097 [Acetonema longum DSM 6540]